MKYSEKRRSRARADVMVSPNSSHPDTTRNMRCSKSSLRLKSISFRSMNATPPSCPLPARVQSTMAYYLLSRHQLSFRNKSLSICSVNMNKTSHKMLGLFFCQILLLHSVNVAIQTEQDTKT